MKSKNIIFSFLFLITVLIFFDSCRKDNEKMIPIPMTVEFEQNLSAYNIYQGAISNLEPSSGFHLIELNSSLFSNYAKKQRLVKVPIGTELVKDENGIPFFPEGTILVKTFFYYNDERDNSLGKKVIETRLLIKSEGLWNVATYIWNDSQTDATLELRGKDTPVSWITSSGTSRSITYHFPDQRECVSCHQDNSEVLPIGPSLRNMNINVIRNNTTINQLEHFQSIGVLNTFDLSPISQVSNYHDSNVSLEERARAYLDMNCAHCHNPLGWEKSMRRGFDFRYETSIGSTKILEKKDEIKKAIQEGEMPFLGNTIVHQEGVDLIIQYINSL